MVHRYINCLLLLVSWSKMRKAKENPLKFEPKYSEMWTTEVTLLQKIYKQYILHLLCAFSAWWGLKDSVICTEILSVTTSRISSMSSRLNTDYTASFAHSNAQLCLSFSVWMWIQRALAWNLTWITSTGGALHTRCIDHILLVTPC